MPQLGLGSGTLAGRELWGCGAVGRWGSAFGGINVRAQGILNGLFMVTFIEFIT